MKNQRRKLQLNMTGTKCEPKNAYFVNLNPVFVLSNPSIGTRKDPRLMPTEAAVCNLLHWQQCTGVDRLSCPLCLSTFLSYACSCPFF